MFAEQIIIYEYMEMKKEYMEVVHLDSKGWINVANIQDKRYSQYHLDMMICFLLLERAIIMCP